VPNAPGALVLVFEPVLRRTGCANSTVNIYNCYINTFKFQKNAAAKNTRADLISKDTNLFVDFSVRKVFLEVIEDFILKRELDF